MIARFRLKTALRNLNFALAIKAIEAHILRLRAQTAVGAGLKPAPSGVACG